MSNHLPGVHILIKEDPPHSGVYRLGCGCDEGVELAIGDLVLHHIRPLLCELVNQNQVAPPLTKLQAMIDNHVEDILRRLAQSGGIVKAGRLFSRDVEWHLRIKSEEQVNHQHQAEMVKAGLITHAQADQMARMARARASATPTPNICQSDNVRPGNAVFIGTDIAKEPSESVASIWPTMPMSWPQFKVSEAADAMRRMAGAASKAGLTMGELTASFKAVAGARKSLAEAATEMQQQPPHHVNCRCTICLPHNEEDDEWELDDGLYDELEYQEPIEEQSVWCECDDAHLSPGMSERDERLCATRCACCLRWIPDSRLITAKLL